VRSTLSRALTVSTLSFYTLHSGRERDGLEKLLCPTVTDPTCPGGVQEIYLNLTIWGNTPSYRLNREAAGIMFLAIKDNKTSTLFDVQAVIVNKVKDV
jgi:hypothetical protein